MEPKGNDMADELVEQAQVIWLFRAFVRGIASRDVKDRRYNQAEADAWVNHSVDAFTAEIAPFARLSRPSTADAVAVKALEWDDDNSARTAFGSAYGTHRRADGMHEAVGCGSFVTGPHSTRDDAKAAAQADYERRIRSALTHPSPQGGAEPGGRLADLLERLDAGCVRTGEGDNGEELYGVDDASDAMFEAASEIRALLPRTHPIGETGGTDGLCPRCAGAGKFYGGTACPHCHGTGAVVLRETGGTDELPENVATLTAMLDKLSKHKWSEYTDEMLIGLLVTGCRKAKKYLAKQARALTSLRAERDKLETAYSAACQAHEDLQFETVAAQSSLAAEKLKVEELEREITEWKRATTKGWNQRAEALEQRVAALVGAVEPIRHYVEMRTKQPLKNLGDSVHMIHCTTKYEAELKFSHLQALAALATEA